MIESRELISATRQLGSMTEAGVDILRAIRVLRAQTQNVELMALYDRLAQELRLGCGLPEAMSHAPEAFSAFAVSLVRQGEARGDLATSFYRIADYLQKEREADAPVSETAPAAIVTMTNAVPDHCPLWLRRAIFKLSITLGGLFAVLFVIEIFVALGIIASRWHLSCSTFVMALFLLGVAWRLRNHEETESQLPNVSKSTFMEDDKSTFDKSSEATFE